MNTPGFCIFKVTLQDGQKAGEVAFNAPSRLSATGTSFDDLIQGIEDWSDEPFFGRFSIPRTLEDFDAAKSLRPGSSNERAIRFLRVARQGDSRLDLQFEYGTPGSHELAMAETASGNVALLDKAPGNVYIATLVLAKDHSAGYLIGQSRGRMIPAANALRMGSIGMRKRLLHDDPDRANRFWDVATNRVAFGDRLSELVEHGQVQEIELVKYEKASSGKRKPKRVVTVTQRGIKANRAKAAGKLMWSWLTTDPSDLASRSKRNEELKAAGTMIDVKFAPEDYDEVGFVVRDSKGRQATIAPSSIVDSYVFPTEGNEAVSSFDDLITQAKPHIEGLAADERLDVDW